MLGAAVDPAAFSEIRVEKGIKSLSHLLVNPVRYSEAPERFGLVLNREFDLERLVPLAEPVQVDQRFESSDSREWHCGRDGNPVY